MKIVVLGAKGMLGHTVFHFLEQQNCHVIPFNERWSSDNAIQTMDKLKKLQPSACVNAMGVMPGKGGSISEALWVNGTLPGWISRHLPEDCLLIHASSDAVFADHSTGCRWNKIQNPDNDYGRSKRQGELGLLRKNDWMIRSSLLGLEAHTKRSLLSWFLAQKGRVSGYTNHMWNGITTLEWARVCWSILDSKMDPLQRVIQPGTLPPLSKYTLLKMVARIFEHPVDLQPVRASHSVQRSLVPNIPCDCIESQLIALRDWWWKLKSGCSEGQRKNQ